MDADLYLTLTRLEAKVDRLLAPEQSPIVTFQEGMVLSGCKSRTTFQRFLAGNEIKSVRRGKFRRTDIQNAIARIIYRARIVSDREEREEGHVVKPEANFHE